MRRVGGRVSTPLVLSLVIAAIIGWSLFDRLNDPGKAPTRKGRTAKAVPVEVAPVERGAMELKRSFGGTLEARAQFVVAPKVSGRVERIYVNIADTIERGQVVAELDNDEYVQAVAQARANLDVAVANVAGARSALDIATREFQRTSKLREKGIASESQFDSARAIWNGMHDKRPALIARCLSAEDASNAVAFARDNGVLTAVLGGGRPRAPRQQIGSAHV